MDKIRWIWNNDSYPSRSFKLYSIQQLRHVSKKNRPNESWSLRGQSTCNRHCNRLPPGESIKHTKLDNVEIFHGWVNTQKWRWMEDHFSFWISRFKMLNFRGGKLERMPWDFVGRNSFTTWWGKFYISFSAFWLARMIRIYHISLWIQVPPKKILRNPQIVP